jgi:hypothetical protein
VENGAEADNIFVTPRHVPADGDRWNLFRRRRMKKKKNGLSFVSCSLWLTTCSDSYGTYSSRDHFHGVTRQGHV